MDNQNLIKVDISVIQRPIEVRFECPHCEEEIDKSYKDFCSEIGEPCDWEHTKIYCTSCGKAIVINNVDWV